MEKVLLLFSGGNDSTLSACNLALNGYDVELISFDNGCGDCYENIRNRAIALERFFNHQEAGKIHNLGLFQSLANFRYIRSQSINMNCSEILNKYGDLNQNQINCLCCRCAMYVNAIKVAKKLGIKYIAEGARKTQLFALEQEEVLAGLAELLNKNGIELLLPVIDYPSDYEVANELMRISLNLLYKGTSKFESKCFLGCEMDKPLTNDEIDGYVKYFNDVIDPAMTELINSPITDYTVSQLNKRKYTKYRFKNI